MLEIGVENIEGIKKYYDTVFMLEDDVGVIRDEGEIVGFYNIYKEAIDSAYLEQLEILHSSKGKGYGYGFFNEIFKKYPEINYIRGLSLEESVSFYEYIGCIFETSCIVCCEEDCLRHPIHGEVDYSTDVCGDYSDNYFTLSREDYYKYYMPDLVQVRENV